MDRIKAWLLARIGPFPIWMWLLIVIAGAALFLWWRKKKGGTGTTSDVTGQGQAPELGNPPFTTDPQYSGGRTEPGWLGPNTDAPGGVWNPLPGQAGSSFDPALSGGFDSFPTITVPQLPTFDAIPPLTPTVSQTATRIPGPGTGSTSSFVKQAEKYAEPVGSVTQTGTDMLKDKLNIAPPTTTATVAAPPPPPPPPPAPVVSKPTTGIPKAAPKSSGSVGKRR